MVVDGLKQSKFPLVRGRANLDAISALSGVTLHDSHRGTFQAGALRAELTFPTVSQLRLTSEPTKAFPAKEALQLTHQFPGNLRFALHEGWLRLMAEVLTQPTLQLGNRFAEVIHGLAAANRPESAAQAAATVNEGELTTERILDALQAVGWDSQSVVELSSGWELRPIVANRPVAVKLASECGSLRLQQVVVANQANADVAVAVYDQALRINYQLQHARLALDAGKIVAEARLHLSHCLVTQLAGAAQAVAVAACHARGVLEILNTHADIAACYASMFCCDADGDQLVATT